MAELVCFSFQETLALPEDGCCLVTTSGDKTLMKDFPSNQSDIVLEGASAHPFFPFVGRTVKLSNPPPQNSDRGGLHLDLGDRSTNETNRPEVKELFPLIDGNDLEIGTRFTAALHLRRNAEPLEMRHAEATQIQ